MCTGKWGESQNVTTDLKVKLTAIFTVNISFFFLSETPRIGSCADNGGRMAAAAHSSGEGPLRRGAYPPDVPVPRGLHPDLPRSGR